jgi:hypothetical protein
MFGHLKADELMDAVDGMSLPANRRTHLDACPACLARIHTIGSVHESVLMHSEIPEPDWDEFRSRVRLELLSRSIQRESSVRRWTGWAIRPAMAWGLSLLLLVFAGAGGFWWHVTNDRQAAQETGAVHNPAAVETTPEYADVDAALAAWTHTNVFEDLATIDGPEAEQVRQLLQSAQEGKLNLQ